MELSCPLAKESGHISLLTYLEREVGRGGSIVAGTCRFRPEPHSPPWTPFTFFGSEECTEEEGEKLLVKATGAEELKQERQIWSKG